jgi:hypothetical protein
MVLRSPQHGSRMWSEDGYYMLKSYLHSHSHSCMLDWYSSSDIDSQTWSWIKGVLGSAISLED